MNLIPGDSTSNGPNEAFSQHQLYTKQTPDMNHYTGEREYLSVDTRNTVPIPVDIRRIPNHGDGGGVLNNPCTDQRQNPQPGDDQDERDGDEIAAAAVTAAD